VIAFRGTTQTFDGWRIPVLGIGFAIGIAILGWRLHDVQVTRTSAFSGRQNRQSIRRVLLPSPRGRIYDRRGVCLADNRPNPCLAVFMEELRRPGGWSNTINAVEAQLDAVAAIIGKPRTLTRGEIATHVSKRLPLPLPVWQNVDEATLARFEERVTATPGVDVYVQPERVYPQGSLAAHVLGYAGREKPEPANDERYHFMLLGMFGRAGIEAQYNAVLEGVPGCRLIRVDVSGYRRLDLAGTDPKPGRDVSLTINSIVQRELERSLAGQIGAGVVLDVRNGDVLALASAPTFDPNEMTPAPTRARWESIRRDPGDILFNRAVQGRYPPGSTFKVIVGLAAMGEGGFSMADTYTCHGIYEMKPKPIRCSHNVQHGTVNLRLAMQVSCNGYFCQTAAQIGPEPIRQMARDLGLGAVSGIDLPGEYAGLVPDAARKRALYHDVWRLGDTCLMSIGQGDLLVSPLQMAVATAAIANGGRVLRPRIMQSETQGGSVVRTIRWRPEQLAVIRRGMEDAVSLGTARHVLGSAVTAAGKTGTAEYGTGVRLKKYAWMIAYAPAENPAVAMAIVIEDAADSGGIAAGPIVRRVLSVIFGAAEETPTEEAGGPSAPTANHHAAIGGRA
jgi:penicillin-binding protein 2